MDYVSPNELMADAVELAKRKASLSIRDMLLRGAVAGVWLGYAPSLVIVVLSQGLPPIVGAALFPAGFVILVLLGFELVTGNFALMPGAALSGQVTWGKLVRNLSWVYLGILSGRVLYALLFYLAVTNFGTSNGGALGDQVRLLAQKKTLTYMALGGSGWGTALVKGFLCNWMVTLGAMLALTSRSTLGKIAAMWLPIMIFFALGYEHSVVNMFLVPAGMLLGAPQASERVRQLAAGGRVLWEARDFRPADLAGIFLAVVATSSPETNDSVFREAAGCGVLCNVVDDPERCDFYYPAVVRRGQLQIAISTGGSSPALAQRIRKEPEQHFETEYEAWVEDLARAP